MGHDDEFDEFDISAEHIIRVIDEGQPVEFGDNVVISSRRFRRSPRLPHWGHADQRDDLMVATG